MRRRENADGTRQIIRHSRSAYGRPGSGSPVLFSAIASFTVTALATLAICLGANLAIFAVVDAILLRPLPFPQSDRLVAIFNSYPKAGVERDGSSLTNYYERRGTVPGFSSLSIFRYGTEVVGDTGSAPVR